MARTTQPLHLAAERRPVPAPESGALGAASHPRAIEWDLDGQLDLLRHLSRYVDELADVRDGPEHRPGEFVWENGGFGAGDALAYYGLVRDLKPKRVIEIGAGASTLLLARAVEANGGDTK